MKKSNYKIVVVDDEKETLSLIEKYLSKTPEYSVLTFIDSEKGLEYVKNNNQDLILLDMMMPKLEGLEFLKIVKDEKIGSKVIMMTAFSTLDRVLESHKLGAEGYIMKPFESLSILDDKIIEVLNL